MNETMLELLEQYRYILLFFGVIVGGETVIIPAVYLAIVGTFNFPPLMAIIIIATVIADSAWYFLGILKDWQKLKKYSVIAKRQDTLESFGKKFKEKALIYLFLSKFVYGTRILAQVLSGAHKIPYAEYIMVNTSAVMLWTSLMTVLGYVLRASFDEFKQTSEYVQLFILFITVIVVFNIWLSKTIKKKW